MPAFTSTKGDHSFYYGDDGSPYDWFRYSYKLELNDADTTKPLTLRLQRGNAGGGGWTDLSGYTKSFSGSGTVWEDYLLYDMFPVALDGELGVLYEMRLACDYTLTDGSTGTVYSTDCGKIYSYKGEYLRDISGELKDGKITARFRVEKGLVLDLSKLTVTECDLWSGGSYWSILDKADIAGPDSDGYYTVTYTLNGEPLDPAKKNYVSLCLRYTDHGGSIDWESADFAHFELHVAPTMHLHFGSGVESSFEPGFGVGADLQLNDLLGGHATVTMYKLVSGSWVKIADFGTVEYNAGDEDEYGVFSFNFYDPELTALWGVNDEGRRYKAKFVVEYTYPDGESGVLESEVFEQYGGGFAHYANTPELRYDAENNVVIAEIALDLSLVESGNVSVTTTSAAFDCWTSLSPPTLTSTYTAGDGTYRMVFTISLGDFSFTPGDYWCTIVPCYSNGMGPLWEQELFVICNLS